MAKKGKLSRRSFLMRVAGGTVAVGAVGAVAGATMLQRSTDADPSDSGGNGRTGITDSDPNDQARHGTGYTGLTDSDSGSCADTGGHGRGNTGYTDSDSGNCSDPGGRGRGPSR
ncbi:hypothetical protein [uncultured Maricaulis sp.]|uniref:hypothetical protein n=1 Tax=uncultured Maricaulis sp. TaxID=174710 RepID=UPI0030DD06C2|tara:strand:- start:137032 stop:137373 length:342 start_codon:yes stop_codon:yes gene_type:complete